MGKKSAFTLIELLVVVAIIALLMALLLPSLRRARNQARAVVCRAHLRQWGTTLSLYLEDSQGRFPLEGSATLWLLSGRQVREDDPKTESRYHAVRTEGIACCPAAVRAGGFGGFTGTYSREGKLMWRVEGRHGSTFTAWDITYPPPPFRMSYGLNGYICSPQFEGPTAFIDAARRRVPLRYTDVSRLRNVAGNVPLLFDSATPSASLRDERQPPMGRESPGSTTLFINRHNGTINGLFLDCSVRPIGLKELWTLRWHLQWDTAGPWTKAGGVKPEDWPPWMRKFKDY